MGIRRILLPANATPPAMLSSATQTRFPLQGNRFRRLDPRRGVSAASPLPRHQAPPVRRHRQRLLRPAVLRKPRYHRGSAREPRRGPSFIGLACLLLGTAVLLGWLMVQQHREVLTRMERIERITAAVRIEPPAAASQPQPQASLPPNPQTYVVVIPGVTEPLQAAPMIPYRSEPVPSKPSKGQKLPPCDRPYVPINGACYQAVEERPPCSRGNYEYGNRCWIPAFESSSPPLSKHDGHPEPNGVMKQ